MHIKTSALSVFFVMLSSLTAFTSFGQKIYNSSLTTTFKAQYEMVEKSREITISDTVIIISNFIGGSEPITLQVNEIRETEDVLMGGIKWFYCVSREVDTFTGKTNVFIVVMKKSNPSEISVHQKLDDVTFIRTVFSLI